MLKKKHFNFLNKPKYLVLSLTFILFFIPIFIALNLGNSSIEKILYFLIFFIIIIFIAEFFFLFFYKYFNGHHYKFKKKIKFSHLVFEPHPYLPFVQKKNFERKHKEKTISFPLNNVNNPKLTTNNFGHFNGDNGDRDIVIPKPKNLLRINCLGGSTTGNYIREAEINYSYPLELERLLKKKYDRPIEVNNFGQGGYNSADILVRFALQSIDTNPDYVIIYHGYNDIRSYLTPNFSSDYSHSRKNLGEVYWKYFLGAKIPNIPLNLINYLINKFFFPLDERSTILEAIAKDKIDINQNYESGLTVYERNLQNLINLCSKNNIKVILSTFCFYLYPSVEEDPLLKLYQKIVSYENEIIKKLAKKNNLILVDTESFIEKNSTNFLDTAHFSVSGMKKLAKCLEKNINFE